MNHYNRQIFINSIISVIQVVSVGLISFYLYRYIIQHVGIEVFGLWSMVLAFTLLGSIGNFGFGNSILKFTAELSSSSDFSTIKKILNASFIFVALVLLGFCFLLNVIGYICLPLFIEANWVSLSKKLLPLLLASLYFNTLSNTVFAAAEGLNKSYIKSLSSLFASIVYLCLTIILIPKYGILGVAYAQLAQYLLLIALSIAAMYIIIPNYSIFYFDWDKNLMQKVIHYGFNFQFLNILQMLYDPITKIFISKYGNLSLVGYFELASKITQIVRSIVISALQTIIPKLSKLSFENKNLTETIKKVFNISYLLAFCTLFIVILSHSAISVIWLKKIDYIFILNNITLGISWFINLLCSPAYFVFTGTGELRPNITSHLIIALLNPILCFILSYYSPTWIQLGWCIALIIGSIYQMLALNKKYQLKHLLSRSHITILFVSLGYLILSIFPLILFSDSYWRIIIFNSILVISYLVFIYYSQLFQSNFLIIKSIIREKNTQ